MQIVEVFHFFFLFGLSVIYSPVSCVSLNLARRWSYVLFPRGSFETGVETSAIGATRDPRRPPETPNFPLKVIMNNQWKRVRVVTVVSTSYIYIVRRSPPLRRPLSQRTSFSFRLFVKFDIEKQLGEKRFYGFHYLQCLCAYFFHSRCSILFVESILSNLPFSWRNKKKTANEVDDKMKKSVYPEICF